MSFRAAVAVLYIFLVCLFLSAAVLLSGCTSCSAKREASAARAIAEAETALEDGRRAGCEEQGSKPYYQGIRMLLLARGHFDRRDYRLAEKSARAVVILVRQAVAGVTRSTFRPRTARVTSLNGSAMICRHQTGKWHNVAVGTEVVSGDKIRTGEDSFLNLTFDDRSDLRLRPGSMVTLDYLTENQELQLMETSVSAEVESTLTARMLEKPSAGSHFDINTPSAQTVLRDVAEVQIDAVDLTRTRVAVRDGQVEVIVFEEVGEGAKGEPVLVGANEGIHLVLDKLPDQVIRLLSPPQPLDPIDRMIVARQPLDFRWKSVDGAKWYHLEVASDQLFRNVVYDQLKLEDVKLATDQLEVGTFFWRVSSVATDGMEGGFSRYRYLVVPLSDGVVPVLEQP